MEEKEEKKEKFEFALIIFLDDDNTQKSKTCLVLKEHAGVSIKIKEGKPFFIPWHRVLKIKIMDFDK